MLVCINQPLGGLNLILTNLQTVPGKTIREHYGLVAGSTVRAKHIGRDILAGLKNIVGGELTAYTELMEDARREAILRMIAQARTASIIANVRIETSAISGDPTRNAVVSVEAIAYGTAVRYKTDDSLRTAADPF